MTTNNHRQLLLVKNRSAKPQNYVIQLHPVVGCWCKTVCHDRRRSDSIARTNIKQTHRGRTV